MNNKFIKQSGLSLIELMIVVAIIGILAALAIPRFQIFQAKARQVEAKTNLNTIFTLQASYFGENDAYASFGFTGFFHDNGNNNPITSCNIENELGFRLTDCQKVRYAYRSSNSANGFDAEARTGGGVSDGTMTSDDNLVFPGCDTFDFWTIDQDRTLQNQEGITSGYSEEKAINYCI